jgi:hypothetical protein
MRTAAQAVLQQGVMDRLQEFFVGQKCVPWCIQSSHNSSTVSRMDPSPKSGGRRRISITVTPLQLGIGRIGTQSPLVEFADLLQSRLESPVVAQRTAYLGNLFGTQADMPNPPSGISHRKHRYWMSFSSFTLWAPLTVANYPLQQQAAKTPLTSGGSRDV